MQSKIFRQLRQTAFTAALMMSAGFTLCRMPKHGLKAFTAFFVIFLAVIAAAGVMERRVKRCKENT